MQVINQTSLTIVQQNQILTMDKNKTKTIYLHSEQTKVLQRGTLPCNAQIIMFDWLS
jgi:hypothetical protein